MATVSVGAPVLRDFPDRLSPMLVKELRQGMRTKMFTTAFIVVQGAMILIAFFSAVAAGAGLSSTGLTGVFWGMLVFLLIFVMPLRAFGVLSNEMRDDTMETILLTRLSAWRIVFGKWLALVTQTTLLLLAITPYVVLRYWLGGVNLAVELFWVTVVWLVSCLMTAILAGFSGQRGFLLRAALAFALLVGAFSFCMMTTQRFSYGYGRDPIPHSSEPAAWAYYLDWIVFIAFGVYYFLDFGASQIAPEAANLSLRKRLVSLLTASFLLASIYLGVESDFAMSLVFVVGIISIVDALTEPATLVPSVYRKFYKWGLPGRIALLGLGPGWPYGFGYFIVCMWLMFLGLLASEGWPLDAPLALVSLIGTVIWPVAWIRLFHSKAERTFVHYIVIQIILVLLTMLLFFMDEAADVEGVLYLGVFLPSVGLFYGNFYGDEEWEALAAIVIGVVSVLCLLVVGLAAHRHMRQVRGIVAGLAGESQGGRDGNASETPQ